MGATPLKYMCVDFRGVLSFQNGTPPIPSNNVCNIWMAAKQIYNRFCNLLGRNCMATISLYIYIYIANLTRNSFQVQINKTDLLGYLYKYIFRYQAHFKV